jgi:hypothetical protein
MSRRSVSLCTDAALTPRQNAHVASCDLTSSWLNFTAGFHRSPGGVPTVVPHGGSAAASSPRRFPAVPRICDA